METAIINIINPDAIAILEGMEHAGLISLTEKEIKHKNLAKHLRGSISRLRAKEMTDTIAKERETWEQRY